MSKRKTHEEYVEELKIKNPTVEVVGKYVGFKTKIMHHCLIHDVHWEAYPGNVIKGKGCKECMKEKVSSRLVKSHEQYVSDLSIKNPSIEVVDEYINALSPIKHHCLIHDVYWEASPANALNGQGCPECKKDKLQNAFSKEHDQYVIDVSLINPDIEVVGRYINAKTPILHRCKLDGNEWYAQPDNILAGRGCPQCKESNGERHIRLWLDNNDISYIQEKSFNDCRDKQPLPFDFYLPDYNACIEYQGQQHYHVVDIFGDEETFNLQQKHDNIKKEYCETNNIKLLCIPYYEDVDEQLNNFLFI